MSGHQAQLSIIGNRRTPAGPRRPGAVAGAGPPASGQSRQPPMRRRTVFCCEMDPPPGRTRGHDQKSCRAAATWNRPGVIRRLRSPQPSVAPQCYGRALICQPAHDLPFHPSAQVRSASPPVKFRCPPVVPAPALSPGARRWRTVPGRPGRSAGRPGRSRCPGPATVASVRAGPCSRTGPGRLTPGP